MLFKTGALCTHALYTPVNFMLYAIPRGGGKERERGPNDVNERHVFSLSSSSEAK